MLRFVGDGDRKKFTTNPRHSSMQNSQATSKNKSTKVFWRAGKVKSQGPPGPKSKQNSQKGSLSGSAKKAPTRPHYSAIGDTTFYAQYDWTTGVLDNGNEWRKFRAVPRLYPLRFLVCTLFNKGGSRGAFRLPGVRGDHFHCTVELSPGHIRC